MIRMIFVLACSALLLTLGGCTNSITWNGPTVEPLRDGGGVVESGMFRQMPYVMASINGSEPKKFLFDTGATFNVLFVAHAEELGIHPVGMADVTGSSGLTKELPLALVDRIEFGPVSMSDMVFIIHDLPAIASMTGPEIAGIIGITGLENFTIDIDYPNKQIAITNERLDINNPDTSVLYTEPSGLRLVPMRFDDPEAQDSKRVVWGLLDTGAVSTFNLHSGESELLLDQKKITTGHRSFGIHGIEQISEAGPMKTGMMLGDTQIEGIKASVSNVESRLNAGILRNFRIRIDGQSDLISFTRTDNAERLVSTVRLGITNLWKLDVYRIDQVIEDSPAYLMGIRAFDEVLLIDGVAPTKMHYKTQYWSVDPRATTITIRIGRWGDDSSVDVVLPIDGSVEGLEPRDQINEKQQKVNIDTTGKDRKIHSQKVLIGPSN